MSVLIVKNCALGLEYRLYSSTQAQFVPNLLSSQLVNNISVVSSVLINSSHQNPDNGLKLNNYM